LPVEAGWTEVIVGFFDGERAAGSRWTAVDFTERAAAMARQQGTAPAPPVSEEDLDRVRARRAELFALWRELPPGETLELPFDRVPVAAGD
jgi:hypothetical protein